MSNVTESVLSMGTRDSNRRERDVMHTSINASSDGTDPAPVIPSPSFGREGIPAMCGI